MNYSLSVWEPLEKLIWRDVPIIAGVLLLARLLILAMQWTLRRAAETARPTAASLFFASFFASCPLRVC